jgi:hypothetical protein
VRVCGPQGPLSPRSTRELQRTASVECIAPTNRSVRTGLKTWLTSFRREVRSSLCWKPLPLRQAAEISGASYSVCAAEALKQYSISVRENSVRVDWLKRTPCAHERTTQKNHQVLRTNYKGGRGLGVDQFRRQATAGNLESKPASNSRAQLPV